MIIDKTIYLDYQASTPVDAAVLDEMLPYFSNSFGNPHSSDHVIGWKAAKAIEQAANRVAGLIGADPDEIIFTSGATESNNLALIGLGAHTSNAHRRRILISAIEHKCVIEASRALQRRFGLHCDTIPVDNTGEINLEVLQEKLADDVLLVSIMAVNNEIGTIQDIPAISKIVEAKGARLHCDAAQAPCAIDLSGISRFVDFLSLSGHKMYGPQGIGALFVRRDLKARIEPLMHGGGQQDNLRSGTVPLPLCVGLGAAAEISKTANRSNARIRQLRNHFVENLLDCDYPIVLNGPDLNQRHPGNANVCLQGCNAQDVLGMLQPYIAASTGSACSSGAVEPSHVLQAIGLSKVDAAASIRFSLGRHTTEDCINQAVKRIHGCIDLLLS